MVDSALILDSVPYLCMAQSPAQLHHGIPGGTGTDALVHAHLSRILMRQDINKITCSETITSHKAHWQYLTGTWDQGLIMHPDHTRGFECWVDSDFAGNWTHQDAPSDPMTVKYCARWVISYMGCLIS